jgi:hypothetical protein
MLSVDDTEMPRAASKYLDMTSDDHSYIYGDFEVCPLGPDQPGHMRSACIINAERLVIQPLRREMSPFRLRSTWAASGR